MPSFNHRQLDAMPLRRNSVSGKTDVVVEVAGQSRAARIRQRPAAKIDAIISLTVVLPLLPVTATSGIVKRLAASHAQVHPTRHARIGHDAIAGSRPIPSGTRVAQQGGRRSGVVPTSSQESRARRNDHL